MYLNLLMSLITWCHKRNITFKTTQNEHFTSVLRVVKNHIQLKQPVPFNRYHVTTRML